MLTRNDLKQGGHYLLRTYDENGNEELRSDWVRVTWIGEHLVSANGNTWTEWLETPEDIFPA